MDFKKIGLLVVFVILSCFSILNSSDLVKGSYLSQCPKPAISPDDRYIFYWDCETPETIWGDISLYVYDIQKKTKLFLFKRSFSGSVGAHYSEDIEEFFNIRWSPKGDCVAFAIDGINFEVLDFKSKKIVGTMNFIPDESNLGCGYFGMQWMNNNQILVSFITDQTNLSGTDDAYGLACKKGDQFVIEQKMIDAKSAVIPRGYKGDEWKQELARFKGYPILIISQKDKVKKMVFKESMRFSTWEIFDIPEINSDEHCVLEVSRSGKLAVVAKVVSEKNHKGSNECKDCKTRIKIVKIPKKFRKELSRYFDEIFRKI
jgi:hypothetical protein